MVIPLPEKNRISKLHETYRNKNGRLVHEQKFHELTADIEFTFDLHHDKGRHTQQRKWRHGKDERIYDIEHIYSKRFPINTFSHHCDWNNHWIQ